MAQKIEVPDHSMDLYDKLLASYPEIKRKGKTIPYTSVNGHMFSFLTKEGILGLRLPKEERAKFISELDTKLMEQRGRVMKEYVVVPTDLFENTGKLKKYLKMSYEYVSNLKPKPTKK